MDLHVEACIVISTSEQMVLNDMTYKCTCTYILYLVMSSKSNLLYSTKSKYNINVCISYNIWT